MTIGVLLCYQEVNLAMSSYIILCMYSIRLLNNKSHPYLRKHAILFYRMNYCTLNTILMFINLLYIYLMNSYYVSSNVVDIEIINNEGFK